MEERDGSSIVEIFLDVVGGSASSKGACSEEEEDLTEATYDEQEGGYVRLDDAPTTRCSSKKDIHDAFESNCTQGQVLFNSVNYMLGSVILSAPYVIRRSGLYGLLLYAFLMNGTWVTAKILNNIMEDFPNAKSYGCVAKQAFGKSGELVASIVQVAELFGYACSCVITNALLIDDLVPGGTIDVGPLGQKQVLMIASTLFILPTVWVGSLRPLAFLSGFGVLVFAATLTFLFASAFFEGEAKYSFMRPAHFPPPGEATSSSSSSEFEWEYVMSTFGLVYSVFSTHAVIPDLRASMSKKSEFSTVIDMTYIICSVVWLFVAVVGYFFTCGEDCPSFLIVGFGASWMKVCVHVLFFFLVCVKFPLCVIPVSRVSERALGLTDYGIPVLVIRTTWVVLVLVVSLLVSDFATVVSLIGAVFCTLLCAVLPSAFAIRLLGSKMPRRTSLFVVGFSSISIAMACANLYCIWKVGA